MNNRVSACHAPPKCCRKMVKLEKKNILLSTKKVHVLLEACTKEPVLSEHTRLFRLHWSSQ